MKHMIVNATPPTEEVLTLLNFVERCISTVTVDYYTTDRATVVPSFVSSVPAPITATAYAARVASYSGYGYEGILRGLVLVARYCKATGERLTDLVYHRLLLAAVVVAAKMSEDVFYCNAYESRVGGVPTSEMNRLELELLTSLHFSVLVTHAQIESLLSVARKAPPTLGTEECYLLLAGSADAVETLPSLRLP